MGNVGASKHVGCYVNTVIAQSSAQRLESHEVVARKNVAGGGHHGRWAGVGVVVHAGATHEDATAQC